eukprot:NP_510618.2 Prion-like-(Q/N-rich)-domain-bearing protein [Caenorhabditis elegans]
MDANRELIARYVDQYHRYPLFFFVHHLLFNLFSYLKGVIRHETPRTMDELFAIVIAESEEQGSESLNHATREVQRQFADLVPFFNEVFTNLLEFRPTFRGKVLVLSLMTHQEEEYVNEFEENFQDRHESYRLRVRQKWAIAKLAQIWVDQYRTGKGKRLHKALYGRIPALAYEKTEWGTWKVVDRKAPMVECLTRRMARQGAAMVPVPQQAQEENKPMGDFVFFLEQMEEEAEQTTIGTATISPITEIESITTKDIIMRDNSNTETDGIMEKIIIKQETTTGAIKQIGTDALSTVQKTESMATDAMVNDGETTIGAIKQIGTDTSAMGLSINAHFTMETNTMNHMFIKLEIPIRMIKGITQFPLTVDTTDPMRTATMMEVEDIKMTDVIIDVMRTVVGRLQVSTATDN